MYMQIKFTTLLVCISITSALFAGEWIFDKNSNCKLWNPHPLPNETVYYGGPCVKGIANGKGNATWEVKGKRSFTYVGEFKEGRLTGNGFSTEFKNGFMSYFYDGDHYNGTEHGKGKAFIFDEHESLLSSFEGNFKFGKIFGKVIIKEYRNKKVVSILEGEFVDGIPQGKFIGDLYKNGKAIKKHVIKFKDGKLYEYGTQSDEIDKR